jgi:hypothetical protein
MRAAVPADALLGYYAQHSRITDPGASSSLVQDLPEDVPGLCRAIQGLVVHYRASGNAFSDERLREASTRWTRDILARIQARDPSPLNVAREPAERFVGCCRDYAVLFVSTLRERGLAARARVGFATYFSPDFRNDHVVAEYWHADQERWVLVDPELGNGFPFDVHDLPPDVFLTAAEVWQRYRAGAIDPELFGVAPDLPYRGAGFIRNYVVQELAALRKTEMLLWDAWGFMERPMEDMTADELALVDRVAALLRAPDAAWSELRSIYEQTPGFTVPRVVTSYTPTGVQEVRLSLEG